MSERKLYILGLNYEVLKPMIGLEKFVIKEQGVSNVIAFVEYFVPSINPDIR